MATPQSDLFQIDHPVERRKLSDETVALIRRKLHDALDHVRSAVTIEPGGQLEWVHLENYVRGNLAVLDRDEANDLWRDFDRHMDRLCASFNAGKDIDLD